jgi:Mg-chelatase subunit ChlD
MTRTAPTALSLLLATLAVGCGAAAPKAEYAATPDAPAAAPSAMLDAPPTESAGDRGAPMPPPPPASPAPPKAPMAEEAEAPRAVAHLAGGAARPSGHVVVRKGSSYEKKADDKAYGAVAVMPSASVKAGEWDDNANYREFQKWLGVEGRIAYHHVDVRDRQFIVVRDVDGKAVPRCRVSVIDERGHKVTLTTTASGRAILFPRAEGLVGRDLSAATICQNGTASARFSLAQSDGLVDLKLNARRSLPATREVDVAFILDTTGSMSEEIAAVKATLQKVASSLSNANARIRIGLVEYKDRTDNFVTKVYPMTNDIGSFSRKVASIQATGGGDTPEAMNEGVHAGLTKLQWNDAAVAKLAFVIADAPPHLDYPNDFDYAVDMREAAHRGIQLFTVAASGMDELGQIVMRQMAQYTGATNLFVLRGGAGPQSTGGGDPKSSCGGTQTQYASGNLDALIVRKIARELKGLDRDPMLIPGRFLDENAKPCKDRLMIAE